MPAVRLRGGHFKMQQSSVRAARFLQTRHSHSNNAHNACLDAQTAGDWNPNGRKSGIGRHKTDAVRSAIEEP